MKKLIREFQTNEPTPVDDTGTKPPPKDPK